MAAGAVPACVQILQGPNCDTNDEKKYAAKILSEIAETAVHPDSLVNL